MNTFFKNEKYITTITHLMLFGFVHHDSFGLTSMILLLYDTPIRFLRLHGHPSTARVNANGRSLSPDKQPNTVLPDNACGNPLITVILTHTLH